MVMVEIYIYPTVTRLTSVTSVTVPWITDPSTRMGCDPEVFVWENFNCTICKAMPISEQTHGFYLLSSNYAGHSKLTCTELILTVW